MDRPWLGKLPKLDRDVYRGYQLIHWTLTFENRATGWLDAKFHSRFREFVLHVAARHPLICPIYVLMPDHIHLVWSGLSPGTDQRSAMMIFRRWLRMAVRPHRLQRQAHDHVLRSWKHNDQAFDEVLPYVWENPVRAGLVERPEEWPYAGSIVPGYPLLHPRQKEWRANLDKIYARLRRKFEFAGESDG
jgi:putative transposase